MTWALSAVFLLALVSPASGQAVSTPVGPAPVSLQFHVINYQDFPINTQQAQFGGWDQTGTGLATETLSCFPNPPAGGSPFQESHTWRGYSSPGYVEYDFMEGGMPRTAPERQMGYNGSLAVMPSPVLHWYLETSSGAPTSNPLPDPGLVPVVVPNVVVEATVRASKDAISVDDKAYDAGPVLAHGRSAPAMLAADASQGVVHSMVGGHHVYEFQVPLDVQQAAIGSLGYTLRIDAYVANPACAEPGHDVMPNLVQPFADAQHRPRIDASVADPLRIVSFAPRFVNHTVVVEAFAQSLWGNYDVDEGNLTMAIEGPGLHASFAPSFLVQRTHEYDHHADPVDIRWDFDEGNLTPGLYFVNLTILNDQHTASAVAHAAFRIGPDQAYAAPQGGGMPDVSQAPQPVPTLGFPAVVALLAVAFVLRKGSFLNR